jgi:hypothetical protein
VRSAYDLNTVSVYCDTGDVAISMTNSNSASSTDATPIMSGGQTDRYDEFGQYDGVDYVGYPIGATGRRLVIVTCLDLTE